MSAPSIITAQKKRKRRVVHGAFIKIDDITVGPGHNYKNWKVPAIQKLKQREISILTIKTQKIVDICNQVIYVLFVYILRPFNPI